MSRGSSASQDIATIPKRLPLWAAYYQLTRFHLLPAGADVVFWPCTWGLTMGAFAGGISARQLAVQTFLFLVGSTLRHSAACIWNDICDREYDRQVERTKSRPIASGLVSIPVAVSFSMLHVALCCLLLKLAGVDVLKVGLAGALAVDVPYPLMKRWTYWPQAVLGAAIALGIPVAWLSISGPQSPAVVIILSLGSICWTIFFDTIYACQDRRDDIKAGIRSTAVLFGDYIKPILTLFAIAFVACLGIAGYMNGHGLPYFLTTVLGTAAHLIWQLATVDFDNGRQCGNLFRANGHLGYLIWTGMLLDFAVTQE
ncbi:UbiA prenyltransferase [Fomitopsis serialis]|uniref:UbiA prenyltransferase n=1 Tax=Fomitopsis serialis TaxID=139415 RepID=UPI0020076E7F|nr:UbiA prenyltransferase [Neoantrodia serialis]KAH9912834.1 UbiA prenyltransferase [Neoantrodia serialis]